MIVIGDVHGEYDALMRLIKQLPEDDICFVGDVIDRGPKSRQVIEYIIKNGHDCVQGNHEYMLYESPYSSSVREVWNAHGGPECRASYKHYEQNIDYHREWAVGLPLYIEYKDCIDDGGVYLVVSHTGINYLWSQAKPYADPNSYFGYSTLWENDWEKIKTCEDASHFYNVFGHSPQKNGPCIAANYACIDGGSFKKEPDLGRLTALQYPSFKVWEEIVDSQ